LKPTINGLLHRVPTLRRDKLGVKMISRVVTALGALLAAAGFASGASAQTGPGIGIGGGGSVPGTVSQYLFTGFSQPVDMTALNMANAGQVIPVQWRLTDLNGVAISDPTSFVALVSYPASCTDFTYTTTNPLPSAEAAGASGLQYMGDGNYQFNWKTQKSYASSDGPCRVMGVQFNDNSTSPIARFQFY
jgi:hypothetical protein